MSNESNLSDAEREALALVTVGISLATVGLIFPSDLLAETVARYGMLVGGVAVTAAGARKALRARSDGG